MAEETPKRNYVFRKHGKRFVPVDCDGVDIGHPVDSPNERPVFFDEEVEEAEEKPKPKAKPKSKPKAKPKSKRRTKKTPMPPEVEPTETESQEGDDQADGDQSEGGDD